MTTPMCSTVKRHQFQLVFVVLFVEVTFSVIQPYNVLMFKASDSLSFKEIYMISTITR